RICERLPARTRMRAPIASRLLFVPTSLKLRKWLPLPPPLCSSKGGSPLLPTTTSANPSLSKSANATPRPTYGVWNPLPAVIVVVAQGNAHSSHHASTSGETHPGDRSNLIELAVALVVVKKRVQSIVGHEQIGPAVVVVVSRPHGKILALRIVDSHGLRYVC